MAGTFSKLQLFNIDCPFNWDDCGWVMHDRRMVIVGFGLCAGGLYLLNRYAQSKQKQLESRQEAICNFPSLWGHTNLMSKHLTPEMYVQLRNKRTKCEFSLDSAIQPGVDHPGDGHLLTVGLVAGDEETYSLFADLFDVVIADRHNGYKQTDFHKSNLDPIKIKHGKMDENFIMSCRIRTCRSIRGFGLPPICTRHDRRQVEKIVKSALASMQGDLTGRYYSLTSMSAQDRKELKMEHIQPNESRFSTLTSGGIARDWPDARGVWHNKEKNFLVAVNTTDHVKLVSVEKGGDMERTFERFSRGVKEFEKLIESSGTSFMWNQHLGFINTCPSNLGTAMKASVEIKLPSLGKDPRFDAALCSLRLQKQIADGEGMEDKFEISNADRLGHTEVEYLQQVIDGTNLLIKMEKRLQRGLGIDELLPYKL